MNCGLILHWLIFSGAEFYCQFFQFFEGDFAEAMFHAVDVFFASFCGDLEEGEELFEDFVAVGDFFADGLAFFG